MINETLTQWFETLEDEQHIGSSGTWANAWSPVWDAEKKVPVDCTSSEGTQILAADMHGDSSHHE